MGKKINTKSADNLKENISVLSDEKKVEILFDGIMKMVEASKLKGNLLIPTLIYILGEIIYTTCDEDKRGPKQWLEISKQVMRELLRALTEVTHEKNEA